MKGALSMGLLSLKGPVEGGPGEWGGAPSPWKICSDSLWIWASLSIGAPMEPRETWCLGGEAPIPGTLKDGWRAPLLGNPKIC